VTDAQAERSLATPVSSGSDRRIDVVNPRYWVARFFVRLFFFTIFRGRHYGARRAPARGGVLLFSNHQSFFDPMLAALAMHREAHFMARDTLFRPNWWGRVLLSLNAFPVRRASADLTAMKEAIRRLRGGGAMVVFPEGTRTQDGSLGRFHLGSVLLAQRAEVPIIPVYIDGALNAWPRDRRLPRPAKIRVFYARPLSAEQVQRLPTEEIGDILRHRMERLVRIAGRSLKLRRTSPR